MVLRSILLFAAVACSSVATTASAQPASAERRADASHRRSLSGVGAGSGGHDGRFFLQSQDRSDRFELRGESQFRYYSVFGLDDDGGERGGEDEAFGNGFEHTRHRLDFSGHAMDTRLKYRVRGDFARSGGAFTLVDANASYDLGDGWRLRWGQYKIAYDREFSQIGGASGLAVERSLASTIFRLNRSQGVELRYQTDDWRVSGTFHDGRRAANTSFFSSSEADIALTGRLEAKLGEAGWRQFGDATSFREAKTGVLLGDRKSVV